MGWFSGFGKKKDSGDVKQKPETSKTVDGTVTTSKKSGGGKGKKGGRYGGKVQKKK